MQRSEFTRHIKPKKPETGLLKVWGYVAAGIVYVTFGIGMILWNMISRNSLGMKKRGLRDLDDL